MTETRYKLDCYQSTGIITQELLDQMPPLRLLQYREPFWRRYILVELLVIAVAMYGAGLGFMAAMHYTAKSMGWM